jgi:hypothetical protein
MVPMSAAASPCSGPGGRTCGQVIPRAASRVQRRTSMAKKNQTIQHSTAKVLSRNCGLIELSSVAWISSQLGTWSGRGQPTKCTRAQGKPATSASRTTVASRPRRTRPTNRSAFAGAHEAWRCAVGVSFLRVWCECAVTACSIPWQYSVYDSMCAAWIGGPSNLRSLPPAPAQARSRERTELGRAPAPSASWPRLMSSPRAILGLCRPLRWTGRIRASSVWCEWLSGC